MQVGQYTGPTLLPVTSLVLVPSVPPVKPLTTLRAEERLRVGVHRQVGNVGVLHCNEVVLGFRCSWQKCVIVDAHLPAEGRPALIALVRPQPRVRRPPYAEQSSGQDKATEGRTVEPAGASTAVPPAAVSTGETVT